MTNSGDETSSLQLSIVIPAYNESERLPPTLREVHEYLQKRTDQCEIIVVNDGSTDNTAEVVEQHMKEIPQLSLLSLEKNSGKGAATKAGMLAAKGERILFADADGSTPISELARLEEALEKGAEVAIGSRALSSQETNVETSIHRKALGRIFNWSMNLLVLPGIADTQCGFKLFRRKAAKFLFSRQQTTGFSFDLEILFMAKKIGLSITEVPINWQNVDGSKVDLFNDSRKMFFDALKIRGWHKTLSRDDYNDFS